MTRKHFEAMADIIDGQFRHNTNFSDSAEMQRIKDSVTNRIMIEMASRFENMNPAFDANKFFKACRTQHTK